MRVLVTAWGIGGVLLVLAHALARLVPRAAEALRSDLGIEHWAALVLWLVFMGYVEGWRGFHQRFSPRLVARAFHLAGSYRAHDVLLAPAYCMSLYHANRRGLIVSWSLVIGIVILVVLLRFAPQPWRGLVDAGVVLGLGMGLLSIVFHTVRALGRAPAAPPDLPGSD